MSNLDVTLREHSSEEIEPDPENVHTVIQAFEPFAAADYAFYPVSQPFVRALFKRFWVLPLIVMLVYLALSLFIFFGSTNSENRLLVFSWMRKNASDVGISRWGSEYWWFDNERSVIGPFYPENEQFIGPHGYKGTKRADNDLEFMLRGQDLRLEDLIFDNDQYYIERLNPRSGRSHTEWFNGFVVSFQYPLLGELREGDVVVVEPLVPLDEWQDRFADPNPYVTLNTKNQLFHAVWFDAVLFVIPIMLILIVLGITVPRFLREAPEKLVSLAKDNRLEPPSDDSNSSESQLNWHSFATELNNQLLSPRKWIMIAFLTILLLLLVMPQFSTQRGTWEWITSDAKPEFLEEYPPPASVLLAGRVREYLIVFGFPLLLFPFVILAFWSLWTVGKYVALIPTIFTVTVAPNHGDRCGGLKPVGDIFLNLAAALLIPSLVLTFWIVTGVPSMSIAAIDWGTYGLAIFIIFLALLTFFYPVRRFHQLMTKKKEVSLRNNTRASASIESEIGKLVQTGEWDDRKISDLKEQLEIVNLIYPVDRAFPTWPFDTRMLALFMTLLLPQVLSIILSTSL